MPNAFQRQRQTVYINEDLREHVNYRTPAEFAQIILDLVKKHEDVHLTLEYEEGSSWTSGTFCLTGTRPENDEEYAQRIAEIEEGERLKAIRMQKTQSKQLERDRAEYLRLKDIFEKEA